MAVSTQHIPTNRRKAILMGFASLAFIVLAIFYCLDESTVNDGRWSMYLGLGLFIPAFLLFLYIGLVQPFYLRMDASGIDLSTSLGLRQTVAWDAVQGFRRASLGGNHFILVDVDKPHTYIKNAPNAWAKRRFQGHYKNYGTPIIIGPSFLSITREDLMTLLEQAYEAHQTKTPIS